MAAKTSKKKKNHEKTRGPRSKEVASGLASGVLEGNLHFAKGRGPADK